VSNSNWCVPLFAAKNNYLNLMSYYLSLVNEDKSDLLKQLCVVSCIYDRYECFSYLIDTYEFNINESDSLFGETPLTASCSYGRKQMCEYLFEKTSASVNQLNKKQLSPLLCAIKSNEWQLVEYLLTLDGIDIEQCDKHGRSALIIASSEGHLAIIDILIEKQADLKRKDCDGLTSLSWSCLKGNYNAAITLVENGADIHHEDDSGRSTLDLATFSGDFRLVQFLVDHHAHLEHADHIGMRPLDRAISCGYNEIVLYFLNKGAKLSNATWAVASDKLDIIFLLLNKLIEDGNRFYKKNQHQDALYRYTYAYKKFPSLNLATNESDTDKLLLIQFNLYLNLGRTYRKLGDFQNSIDHCTKALELNPISFEAFYTRARAKRDFHMFDTALSDLYEAQHLNPTNLDVKKLLSKVIIDIKKSNQKSSPSSQSSLCTYFSSRNETNI
jgi:ankyrin repeat protein